MHDSLSAQLSLRPDLLHDTRNLGRKYSQTLDHAVGRGLRVGEMSIPFMPGGDRAHLEGEHLALHFGVNGLGQAVRERR